VKFPVFPLLTGGQCGAGGRISKLVHAQRQIFEDDLDGITVFFERLLEQRRNFAAVRSLKIRKDGNRHRGLGKPLEG
jgi:hypothetical protein